MLARTLSTRGKQLADVGVALPPASPTENHACTHKHKYNVHACKMAPTLVPGPNPAHDIISGSLGIWKSEGLSGSS